MKTKKALAGLFGLFGSFAGFSFFAGFLLVASLAFLFTESLQTRRKTHTEIESMKSTEIKEY